MFNNSYVKSVYEKFSKQNEGKKEYLQAGYEILKSLEIVADNNPIIEKENLLERFINPDRFIEFKVVWLDDNNNMQVNKGYRVQYNNAIGPYKGGLRFHPSVNESIIKFLGLEQCLKNSLTTLPLGGGKGGSDFDPKGKSDGEIMRFCQAFMNELYKYIGSNIDVPAGDIGVGKKEIGYMFGQYKKLTNDFSGAFTGKDISFGGSLVRTQATGYGLCYFTLKALQTLRNTDFNNKKVVVSGAGNVAIYAAEKAIQLGGKVVTMSDSSGWIYVEDGINLDFVKEIKEVNKGRIKEYLKYDKNAIYHDSKDGIKVWSTPCDIALPCATQNELDENDAKMLVDNGVIAVCEGANMPSTLEAAHYFIEHGVIYGAGKAANAGGVATSGLEMSQNALRLSWSFEEVDNKLKEIMENIFVNIHLTNKKYNLKENDFLTGANIAGFEKLSQAMLIQGI